MVPSCPLGVPVSITKPDEDAGPLISDCPLPHQRGPSGGGETAMRFPLAAAGS